MSFSIKMIRNLNKRIKLLVVVGIISLSILLISFKTVNVNYYKLVINLKFEDPPQGFDWSNYKPYAQVYGLMSNGTCIEVYRGAIRNNQIVLDGKKNIKFRSLVDSWTDRFEDFDFKDVIKVALYVNIWFVGDNGTVYSLLPEPVIDYNPYSVANKGLTVKLTLDLKNRLRRNTFTSASSSKYNVNYYWKLVDSYRSSVYEKVPILILNNPDKPSSTIICSIDFSAWEITGFFSTIAYGVDIFSKASSKDYDSITLDIYKSDVPFISLKSDFYHSILVDSEEQWYIYIYAKIFYGFYREYRVIRLSDSIIVEEPTGNEKIILNIFDVEIDRRGRVLGGSESGVPNYPTRFMEWFLYGIELQQIFVENNAYLSDGDLDPGEAVPLSVIWDKFNPSIEKYRFGLGVPIGAMVASIINNVLSPVVSPLVLSVNYVNNNITQVGGGIVNIGTVYSEEIWVAKSSYKYRYLSTDSIGVIDVPSGTYIYLPSRGAFEDSNNSGNSQLLW